MYLCAAYKKLRSAAKSRGSVPTPILWTSGLTQREDGLKYLDRDKYIIQVWDTGIYSTDSPP